MGEKVEEKKTAEGGDKKKVEGGEKKENAPIDVVLELDLHCEGCAKKVKRAVKKFEGVGDVKADFSSNKLIVTGTVDPALLREYVEAKTKKKVELISPQPKKDAGGEKKAEQKSEKKADEKKPEKPKESATVVLEIRLHCQGCAHKIKRTIRKNVDGVASVTPDLEKDLVTVTGTMDVNALTSFLQEKANRSVVVVPPQKKEGGGGGGEKKEEKKEGGGEKKEGGGGNKKEEKKEGGGGEKKEEKKEGEKKEKQGGEEKNAAKSKSGGDWTGAPKVEVNKMEFSGYNPYMHYAIPTSGYAVQYPPPPPPTYLQPQVDHGYFNQSYHPGYMNYHGYPPVPPPPTYMNNLDDRMFSDENPNGCSIM